MYTSPEIKICTGTNLSTQAFLTHSSIYDLCLGGRVGATVEGGANGAEADVGEGDGGIWVGGLDGGWVAVSCGAVTTDVSRVGATDGVGGVEPVHGGCVVVPDGHGEDHGGVESGAEARHAAKGLEVVGVVECGLLLVAECISDLVGDVDAINGGVRVGDGHTVLDVEALDGGECAGIGAVGSDELGDDGDDLRGVHGPTNTEEGGVAHTVAVEVTSILVADAGVAVITITTVGSLAAGESLTRACVWGVGSGGLVSLPDIHLRAAGSVSSAASVNIAVRWGPVKDVSLRNVLVKLEK